MNDSSIVVLEIASFSLVYLLLLLVLGVMKYCRISQSRLLFIASIRLTVQLVIAGWVLTYIFRNPHPAFTVAYLLAMLVFAIHRVLSVNGQLNRRFKIITAASLSFSGLAVLAYFIMVIVKVSPFNPQYVIPLGGMIIGNAMTGLNLGLKTFRENFASHRLHSQTLVNLGVHPYEVLLPYANSALETALLPTLNSMLGMGIVALPGMMTGQILSGTLPSTAILYQIAIMISVCTVVCLAVFASLYFGSRTLVNADLQIDWQ